MIDALVQLRQIAWEPGLAAWIVALIGAVALLGAATTARSASASHRFGLRALRVIVILAIAALLLNPSLPTPATPAGRPSLTILVDTSQSMGVPDSLVHGTPTSRLEALSGQWLTPGVLARLNQVADVRMLTFANRAASLTQGEISSLRPVGPETRLAATLEAAITALRTATTDLPGASHASQRVLVLSDAIDSTGGNITALAPLALGRDVRLDFILPTTQAGVAPAADIAITATAQEPLIAAGAAATIDVSLAQQGFEGQTAMLTLREISPVERVLATRQVTLGADSRLSIEVAPTLAPGTPRGLHSIECVASIEHLAAETETGNNADPFFLQVSDEQVRIALFEGEPSWDSRAFIASITDDPRFEVTTVHALGRRAGAERASETIRTRRITPGVAHSTEETGIPPPLSQDALDTFDVIVLGRRIEAIFPGEDAARLARYVTEHSGTLALLRADPILDANDPAGLGALRSLAPVMPLSFEGTAAPSTELFALPAGVRALGTAVTALDEAPDISRIWRARDLSPLASTWIAGFDSERNETLPALISAPVAGGRVMINLADGMWRWSILSPDRAEWRRALAAFWPQTMLALALGSEWAPGQDISLAVDRVAAKVDESVTIVVRARGPLAGVLRPIVRVRGPEPDQSSALALTPAADQPGVWTGVCTASQPGVMTISLPAAQSAEPDLTAHVRVRSASTEMDHLAPDHTRAAILARATGGEVIPSQDVGRYVALIESEAVAASTDTILVPIWRRAGVFWFIVGMLALEWIWRRRVGLS